MAIHGTILAIKDERRAGDLSAQIQFIMYDVDLKGRTIVVAHCTHCIRPAPALAIVQECFWIEIIERAAVPSFEAVFVLSLIHI